MTGERALTLPGGSSFTVATPAASTEGKRVELEITLPPRSAGPPAHFHPRQEEQWHVLAGAISVRVGDEWRTLQAGESVTIPPGTIHTLRNRSPEQARVLDVHEPALDFQEYMETLHRLHARGMVTSLRSPRSLLYMAIVLRAHRPAQVTASPVQRAAESVLAAIGGLLGLRRYVSAP